MLYNDDIIGLYLSSNIRFKKSDIGAFFLPQSAGYPRYTID